MGNNDAAPYVEFICSDTSERLVEDGEANSSRPHHRCHLEERCKSMFVLKIIFPIFLIILGPTLTYMFLRSTCRSGAATSEAPPDVTNLTLEEVGLDSFTVSWERPKGKFDYYWVEVTDDAEGRGGSEHYQVDSCRNGTILHPDQTRITCSNLDACTLASIRVRTHSNGPPARTSLGVTVGGIYIPGKAPEDFKVDARATSSTSAEVVVHVSHIKGCLLDQCEGDCTGGPTKGAEEKHKFTCNDHAGNTSTVLLTGLQPGSDYTCYVWIHNIHRGREMSNFEIEFFTTPNSD